MSKDGYSKLQNQPQEAPLKADDVIKLIAKAISENSNILQPVEDSIKAILAQGSEFDINKFLSVRASGAAQTTLLSYVVSKSPSSRQDAMIKLLLQYGGDPKIGSSVEDSPIIIVAKAGDVKAASILSRNATGAVMDGERKEDFATKLLSMVLKYCARHINECVASGEGVVDKIQQNYELQNPIKVVHQLIYEGANLNLAIDGVDVFKNEGENLNKVKEAMAKLPRYADVYKQPTAFVPMSMSDKGVVADETASVASVDFALEEPASAGAAPKPRGDASAKVSQSASNTCNIS